jgi:hypothetical protein
MIDHPDIEELEQIARGHGSLEAKRHVSECAECITEVGWLQRELVLVSQRPEPDVSRLWTAVERRIQPMQRKTHWHRPALVAAVAATAMVVLFLKRPHPAPAIVQPVQQQQPVAQLTPQAQPQPKHHIDAKSLAALDTAEADYRHAAGVLETEYASLRKDLDPRLASHWDETLTRARAQLVDQQKSVASDDVRGRMQVLDGYAEYLRSLKDVIQNSEEAAP